MNFLVLPLYRQADAMQAQERELEQRLQPWVKHIKKTFSGEERFMMLQTYYRQNHYKQTDALKGSVSLLLEVPFFIAAYRFLSNLTILQGVHFGPIADLGRPDALLQLGGVSVNVLPILMTAINYISASIYMKGFPLRSKLQTYGLALVFLVLLYNSPAGLVFYWTLNNLFSLLKNVFYKMKRPGLVLGAVFSAISVFGAVYFLFFYSVETLRM
jgi:YidC/Oxa1 family membrane protein insertase